MSKEKIIFNILFVVLAFLLIGLLNLLSEYMNPEIRIVICFCCVLAYAVSKIYRLWISQSVLIQKQIDWNACIVTVIIAVFFLNMNIGPYNPVIWGLPQQIWITACLIPIGCIRAFRYLTFTKAGIRRSSSFLKTYYSDITSFELTDTTVSYSTKSGENHTVAIFRPILGSKGIIEKKCISNK
jgi:voltage-gated potassium channel Kch